MNFFKLHGLGNDYIVIDERGKDSVPEEKKDEQAQQLCRRSFGPGADGVLYLNNSQSSDVEMRIFNADGSEAESCGNGLRCCAYYHHGLENKGTAEYEIDLPLASPVRASVRLDQPPVAEVSLQMEAAGKYEARNTIEVEDLELRYHSVDVGNPHAVIFLDENSNLPRKPANTAVQKIGEQFQTHSRFTPTHGINVEFVRELTASHYEMRVFERGVGETTSCGTGSIAVARAAHVLGRAPDSWVTVSQPGGDLDIGPVQHQLRGPAEWVYTAQLSN